MVSILYSSFKINANVEWWLEFDFDHKNGFRVQKHLHCQCWSGYLYLKVCCIFHFHFIINCLVIAWNHWGQMKKFSLLQYSRGVQFRPLFISLEYFSKSVNIIRNFSLFMPGCVLMWFIYFHSGFTSWLFPQELSSIMKEGILTQLCFSCFYIIFVL